MAAEIEDCFRSTGGPRAFRKAEPPRMMAQPLVEASGLSDVTGS